MELEPIYSNVKSFYGKARVLRENDIIKLMSYSTIVATIENGQAHINGFYSATTTRHIKEFLQQYGFEVGTKAQLEKLYC
jgi:hypothetical protein